MAVSRRAQGERASAQGQNESVGVFQATGRVIDETAPVQAIEEAVAQARAKLHEAQQRYHELLDTARRRVSDLRTKNLGDLADDTLGYVRKHPGRSVLMAVGIGMLAGWIFRR